MQSIRYLSALALALFVFIGGPVRAEPQASPPAAPPAGSPGAPSLPNEYRLNLLIRTTIVALNQANMTGNYTVLRDLAAPSFQQANSAAQLAEAFANMRKRNIDLAPILFFEPKLVRPPAIQPNGKLRLSGYFETRPEQVSFDLAFEASSPATASRATTTRPAAPDRATSWPATATRPVEP